MKISNQDGRVYVGGWKDGKENGWGQKTIKKYVT